MDDFTDVPAHDFPENTHPQQQSSKSLSEQYAVYIDHPPPTSKQHSSVLAPEVEEAEHVRSDDVKAARLWATLAHLSGLLSYVAIPFGNLLGPFLICRYKKDVFYLVEDQAKEALNFQISMTVYGVLGVLLGFQFMGKNGLIMMLMTHVLFTLYGAIRVALGYDCRYPMNLRPIR